jgi:hypothetical protein
MMTLENDHGVVSEALFDGYDVGDRLLEGVMFRVQVIDDKVVCLGVQESQADYMKKFSKEQISKWHSAIECRVVDWGGDMLVDGNNEDVWLVTL